MPLIEQDGAAVTGRRLADDPPPVSEPNIFETFQLPRLVRPALSYRVPKSDACTVVRRTDRGLSNWETKHSSRAV
jgi:hypothetical protein